MISGIGGKAGAVQRCPTCRGTGMQVRIQQLGPGMMQQIQTMCSECQGQGERIDPKLRCKKCNGRKVNRERKILEVQIDKGMEDGQKITFGGEGDQVNISPLFILTSFRANCMNFCPSYLKFELHLVPKTSLWCISDK